MLFLKRILFSLFIGFTVHFAHSQDVSFMALGDLHYDRLDLHDWDYVMKRPQDFEQIMKEYPQITAVYLPKFLRLIKEQSRVVTPPVKAVVQLGDLVEGVAGNERLAREMNRGVVDLLYSIEMAVPWVLVKGNHDVSNSPGQPEAWQEVIRPFIEGQVNSPVGRGMYSHRITNQVELFVLDQFFSVDQNLPETALLSFLEETFKKSEARFKFVLTHQPVIPVTDRCWHLMSGIRRPLADPGLRERLLHLLAENKAIVLCAHLHKYSVVSRKTAAGAVVQVMINSVVGSFDPKEPVEVENEYKGAGFVEENPTFQPHNLEVRKKILENEEPYIQYFTRADLPGYSVISVYEKENKVILKYFNGFSTDPFQTVELSALW